MQKPKRHLITSALPYANGPIHLGHLAGAYLPADIYVRYLRLKGEEVLFVCGSDEHGAAITLKAKKDGVSPQAIVDKYHAINKEAFAGIGIDFDIFHRTSSELHHQTASQYFTDLNEKGVFAVQESEQFFDEEHQQFLADRYITGTCPKCANDKAYGDQCEKCGSSLSPTDLINPVSTLSGKPPVLKSTKHWYLPMDRYQDFVREFIDHGTVNGKEHHEPNTWKKHVLGQCDSWLDAGLQPRAMTRDLDWGVKVPLAGADGKVLYVWLDAPIGYISATRQWCLDNGQDWEKWWKDDSTRLVHFIGKDNIVFHCIIFPIILHAHGSYILPQNVPANEFLNLEGQKLSTSRNWAIWLHEYTAEFPDRLDTMRYVLTSIMPETKDSEFTWKDYQARNNNELVAILGNFVNRAVVLTHKFYGGQVPDAAVDTEAVQAAITYDAIGQNLEAFQLRQALAEAMNTARYGNKYLADNEPWKTIKTDPAAAARVIATSLQIAAHLSKLLAPFLPFTAKKLEGLLCLNDSGRWGEAPAVLLPPGHAIGEAQLLFTPFTNEKVEAQVQKLQTSAQIVTKAVEPQKSTIAFEDFQRMDIRIATILEAERVPKTKKLLKLTVDTGIDTRTIVSGIAEHYLPEEVVGRQVCVLVNLAPRDLKGIASQGMVLMAEDADGKLVFVRPDVAVQSGSGVA